MGWRIVLIPLVGVIVVSSAAHGMAPQVLAQPTISLEAPKWDVGDQWSWRIGDDRVTWTVLSAGGEYAVLEKSASERGIIHVAANFSSTRVPSLYFLPQFYQLQFPLALGQVWTYTIRGDFWYLRGEAEFEVTRRSEGLVSITVPAGTFESVRIHGRLRTQPGMSGVGFGANPPPYGDFLVWYAPKVKQVARITWQGYIWRPQYNGANLLLVSYKLLNP